MANDLSPEEVRRLMQQYAYGEQNQFFQDQLKHMQNLETGRKPEYTNPTAAAYAGIGGLFDKAGQMYKQYQLAKLIEDQKDLNTEYFNKLNKIGESPEEPQPLEGIQNNPVTANESATSSQLAQMPLSPQEYPALYPSSMPGGYGGVGVPFLNSSQLPVESTQDRLKRAILMQKLLHEDQSLKTPGYYGL